MTNRTRINIRNHDGSLAGWFALESATPFEEAREYTDPFTQVSVNTRSEHTHQTLYRTARGRWVLADWTDWDDDTTEYTYVDDEEARRWLVLNREDDAVETHFGAPEEEAGPRVGGRPSIGPKVEVRLPAEVLGRVTAYRGERDQADALRELIVAGLDAAS